MRAKLLVILLFSGCLALVGRTAATPGASVQSGELTLQPVQRLPLVMKEANLGQIAPTPTITPPISATVGISGAVYLNPRWVVQQQAALPVEYLILMDATGSMSWDFNGYGSYDGTNHSPDYTAPLSVKGDVQCDSPDNPNPLNLPYTDRCLGGANSAWHAIEERRVYVLKQAIGKFIDQMNAYDAMRVIAFSGDLPDMAVTSDGWSSDKSVLKAAVTTFGSYQSDPYRTFGSASNAIALQKARDLLATAPTVAANGQPYKQVVIMLTDSVANVFLNGITNTAHDICGNLSEPEALRTANPCQVGTTADGTPRPISAMVDMANTLKTERPNIALYVVALAHVDQTGLVQVASDPSFFYPAPQPSLLGAVLDTIQAQVANSTCIPAGGDQWVNSIDAVHLPDPLPGPDDTVVGYTYIYQANSATPLFVLPIQRDPATDKISFLLPPPDADHPNAGIAPGTYEMMAYGQYKGDDQLTRQYDWLVNPNTLSSANRITFTITASSLGGQIIPFEPLHLDLPPTVHVCP